ncbi:MAG: hypothetical protein R3181_11745, partial [Rubricoccaceae bacterium]|nr:hypothetical protein [Rubricoccaceae bacterium]
GKAALLATALAFTLLGVRYALGTQTQRDQTRAGTYGDQRAVQARSAALAGFERAMHHLGEDFTDAALSGTLDGIAYEVDVAAGADHTAEITSEGVAPGPNGLTRRYVVTATVGNTEYIPSETPPFMRYGLMADDDLTLSGNAEILSIGVTDEQQAYLNASVHTNADLHVGSNSTRVSGFGTYVDDLSGHTSHSFQPNHNPDGLAALAQADPVPIPRIDPDAMAALLPVTHDLRAVLLGDYAAEFEDIRLQGGTREAPVVWRLRGDALLDDVVIDGYAILIVEGDVHLDGVVRATGAGYDGPQESPLAIYTTGEVTMSGNTRAYAQIYAEQGVRYQGNVDIYGNLVVGGTFETNGSARIHYIPASPALTRYWDGSLGNGLTLLAYAER